MTTVTVTIDLSPDRPPAVTSRGDRAHLARWLREGGEARSLIAAAVELRRHRYFNGLELRLPDD